MHIENEMLSRFTKADKAELNFTETTLSQELDFFFNNVMGSVVDYFKEEITV